MRPAKATSSDTIAQFALYVQKAPLEKLTAVSKFYYEHLRHIIAAKDILSPLYSKSLLALLEALTARIQEEQAILEHFSELKQIMQQVASAIHPSYVQKAFQKSQKKVTNAKSEQNRPDKPSKISQASRKEQKLSQEQLQYLQSLPLRNWECLGCIQYLYENQNLWKAELIRKDQDAITMPSVYKLKMYEQQLKKSICALANSGGGVILFGCEHQGPKIIARGQVVSETMKDRLPQQLSEIFQQLYPDFSFGQNAHFSCIPVMNDPFSLIDSQNKEGCYVVRLRVWNQTRQHLYFAKEGKQLALYLRQASSEGPKENIEIPVAQIYKTIKRWYKDFNLNNMNAVEKSLQNHRNCFDNHTCTEPLPGKPVAFSKDREQQDPFKLEHNAKYVSMVLANQIPIQRIKSHMVKQKLSHFTFLSIATKAGHSQAYFLFHETSPYMLRQLFDNMEPSVGKPALFLVENAIELKLKLSDLLWQQLTDLMRQLLQGEKLTYYETVGMKRTSYYVCTASKVALIKLFLKLRQDFAQGKPRLAKLDEANPSYRLVLSHPSK